MTKYQKMYQAMLDDCSSLFLKFKNISEKYGEDEDMYETEFNEIGNKALKVIRRYENELCSKSENSQFGKFSENLSEKFWEQVRLQFPLIDKVQLQ